MRNLWIDAGNDPDWTRVVRHSIRGLFFDLRDPRVTADYLRSAQARGYAVGVYAASNWPEVDGEGWAFAENVSALLGRIAPGPDVASFPKVQLDIERHDPAYVAEALTRWRELRPRRDTSWTFEPLQGGWMHAEFVQAVLAARVRLVPQHYFWDMSPVAGDVVLKDLLARGFPPALVSGFYDAARLPAGWDGFAFTQGRLDDAREYAMDAQARVWTREAKAAGDADRRGAL